MDRPFRRLLAFIAVFGAMYVALSQAWGEGLSHWIIDVATVQPAAWVARILTGDATIVADGATLRSSRASIHVLYGCEGSDVLMLLASALLVAPVAWRDRLLGLAAGTVFVFTINQMRVLALLFSIRLRPAWFGPIHGLIAPLLVVMLVAVFFIVWLSWTARTRNGLVRT